MNSIYNDVLAIIERVINSDGNNHTFWIIENEHNQMVKSYEREAGQVGQFNKTAPLTKRERDICCKIYTILKPYYDNFNACDSAIEALVGAGGYTEIVGLLKHFYELQSQIFRFKNCWVDVNSKEEVYARLASKRSAVKFGNSFEASKKEIVRRIEGVNQEYEYMVKRKKLVQANTEASYMAVLILDALHLNEYVLTDPDAEVFIDTDEWLVQVHSIIYHKGALIELGITQSHKLFNTVSLQDHFYKLCQQENFNPHVYHLLFKHFLKVVTDAAIFLARPEREINVFRFTAPMTQFLRNHSHNLLKA